MRPPRISNALLPLCPALCLALLVLSPLGAPAIARADEDPRESRRIVAIGDIHGAIEPLRTILRETKLMDESGRWTGGDAVLVQTGDFLDRGAGTRQVVDLLRSLQEQAPKAGGEVVVLMGNHEAINLIRDMSYVDAELLARWAGRKSDKARRKHCDKALDLELRRAALQDVEAPESGPFREACLVATPPGLVEYLEDLEPSGDLGRWLRTLPAVARIDDILFVHGGLNERTAGLDPAEINQRAADEVGVFDRVRGWLVSRSIVLPTAPPTEVAGAALQVLEALDGGTKIYDAPAAQDLEAFRHLEDWYLVDPSGPLWFRGYATWDDEDGAVRIETILKLADVRAVVAGHTPRKTAAIEERWGGRVYLIDTGMLASHYGGKPSALEFKSRQVRAVYPGVRQVFGDGP